MKNIPIKEMTYNEILEYVRRIYGDDVSTEFDVACISYLRVEIANGKTNKIIATYSKIKVTPKNAPAIYWPIGEQYEELNLEYGQKLIKEIL